MSNATQAVQKIIDRETRAWDTADVDTLVSVFHHDMVWPWPPSGKHHDPIDWVIPFGRFDAKRWHRSWSELFATFHLVHNRRKTVRLEVSAEHDGAFAVVDIDTLWKHKTSGETMHWLGRTCKIYTLLPSAEWKMISQVGVLDYSSVPKVP
jgi:hypothetical protein